MRTFIAITIPDDVRTALADALVDQRPGLRWTRPDQWHVTMSFLDDIEESAEEVAAAIQPSTGPFELRLGQAGRFGDRVLWVGIEDRPAGPLRELARQVRAGLGEAEIPFDARPFRPHVTIARMQRRAVKARDVRWLDERIPDQAWPVDRLHVVHSHLEQTPARHEVVATVPLPTD